MVAFGRFLTGFWLVSDWFLTRFWPFTRVQLDLKARAEIPRCTSGSGGSGGAGWCSSSGCGGSAGGSSKSSNESKDPCLNAFDFKFGSKISLCGPETVRKTHSALAVAVALAVVVVEIGIGVGVGVLVGGWGNRQGRERERLRLAGFWLVSDYFWPFRGTSVKWRKAKAKIPRCSSGSGVAVVAALVVILRVVATLVEGSAHERIRFHIWEEKKIARSGNGPENSQ